MFPDRRRARRFSSTVSFGNTLRPSGNAGDAGGDDLVRRQPRDVGAVEHDAAGARRRQPEDRADQRGLAGAVGAEQAGDAAGLDGERDAFAARRPCRRPCRRLRFRSSALIRPPPDRLPAPARSAATVAVRAFGDLAAEIEHDAAVGDALDHAHLVLDDDDGEILVARRAPAGCRPSARAVSSCVMPADGSSSSSSFGSLISARQISMRRRSIIGRPATGSNMRSASAGSNTSTSARAAAIVLLELAPEGAAPDQVEPQALIEPLVVADHDVVEDRQRQRQPRALEGAGNAGAVDRRAAKHA